MFKFVKKGAFMLFVASLAVAGLTSCDDDDPDYSNVEVPEVEAAPNTISGVVTAKSGAVVAGAKVTMDGAEATTDAAGVYKFDKVAAGTHKLAASKEGMIAAEGEVTIANDGKTQNAVWNATLVSAESQKKVEISATEETKTDVKAEAKAGNEKAEVKVDAEIPAAAVEGAEEGDEIIVAPVYDAAQAAAVSRAAGEMLVGTSISCTNPKATIAKGKKIALAFNVDASLTGASAMKLSNGQWVAAESSVNGNVVTIMADEFTSYGLFLNVNFSSSNGGNNSILSKTFDNLYGSAAMTAGNVDYSFQSGMSINGGSNVLEALLVEKLAAMYGASSNTMSSTYTLGVTLPIGTRLDINAFQSTTNVSASAAGASVSGTVYGGVTVTVTTTNRTQHSGGAN